MKPGALLAVALVAALAGRARASEALSTPDAEAAVESTRLPTEPRGVTVRVTKGAEGFVIEGRSRLRATAAVAWDVLTDYDDIDRFVSSMRESRVTGRGSDYLLVEQVAVGRLLFFSRRMTTVLRVHEEPPGLIRFEDVLGRDFDRYRGEWKIVDGGDQIEISYRLTARPSFAIPDVVARGSFQRTVRSLISEVGAEIERRAAAPRSGVACGVVPAR